MGLCKCPKKKVTNLFCFEHRVNVCEHCLVANHQKCIVQSYLQWLQDSDYDPTCRLCGKDLDDESSPECVRLLCYDVFHWSCLNQYCRQLPANTAPAGYTCPICRNEIFPANNIASPVAEKLRERLSEVNWARAGLGLPLIDEPQQPTQPQTPTSENNNDGFPVSQQHDPAARQSYAAALSHNIPSTHTQQSQQLSAAPVQHQQGPPVTAGVGALSKHAAGSGIDNTMLYTRGDKQADPFQDPRKMFDSTGHDHLLTMSHDHDEDKYKRRSAFNWLARWFKSRVSGKPQRRDPHATTKKVAIVLVIAILALLTLIVIFTRLGRASADSDPFLDPMANPNIRIGNQ